MPVPKKHKTHGRTRSRRSHLALTAAQFVVCAHCGAAALPHAICSQCGYYKGREVLNTLAKLEKKAKKARGKQEELRRQAGKSGTPEEGSLEELSKKNS